MAILHEPIVVQGGRHVLSLGTLIGSSVSSEVFDSINSSGGASFFGSDFDRLNANFVEQFSNQADRVAFELSATINSVMNPNVFRPLITMEDYMSIPECMQYPILMMPEMKDLLSKGQIEGWGIEPHMLGDEDMYGRLCENFSCDDVAEASDENGAFELVGTMYSDDPDLSPDALSAIEESREFIRDKILAETYRDPTAIWLPRE